VDRGWITATLCITACQTTIFKGYRECRMLPQELFAKLHDVNITQPTFLRISIGYRCVAELIYKIVVLCYKAVKLQQPSYLTGLLSPYRQSRVLRSFFINKHCCSSVLMLRLHRLERSFQYALLTVSLVLGLSSRPTCSQDIYSRSTVRASDTLISVFARYKFVTYLLTYK